MGGAEEGLEYGHDLRQELRYERKFLVDQLDAAQVRAIVKTHPSMFYEPYPPRHVNNLYLDTKGLANYFANVAGAEEREKVRIRWYGELFRFVERPILEFKSKSGLVSTKTQCPFEPFSLDSRFCPRNLRGGLRRHNPLSRAGGAIQDMDAVLLNRYYRWYYASRDDRYRITVDTAITYLRVTPAVNTFVHHQADHTQVVVELKYAVESEQGADRISGYFPFRLTKNSKYVAGIERVYF